MLLKQIGEYWNDRAEGYSQTVRQQLGSDTELSYRLLLRRGAPKAEGLNCLDIGCGPGFFSVILFSEGHKVTSFDYASDMLARASSNISEAGFVPCTVQGDAQELPFDDCSFDYIVSRDCIWCLEQPEKAYSEWMRVLKPGGRFLVSDGNYYLYHYLESYAKERHLREEEAKRTGGRVTHDTYGVDPERINEIAKDLPLSKTERPAWDIDCLSSLGFRKLQIQTDSHIFTDPDTGEDHIHTGHFVIMGEKTVC
ncbi:MAG: class I SAM-dependent methyltransferase [Firmicutes bacterium]|nr:class I SAM-dependent methyltransferase [Bacillota bacterium]MBQ6260815.1 class I SAM-dependent methyltransferase [Bacillota bacterium]MBR0114567.1 class I SAM-dependent methyltransferase [Bacillota bacterium]MBR0441660.1 class I SAM-dependent methyltransferase [Bacillota bacterium]